MDLVITYASGKSVTFSLPDYTTLESNNALLNVNFYYFTVSNNVYSTPILLGKLQDIVSSIDCSNDGTFTHVGLCYKFIDNTYNNSTYNEYITYNVAFSTTSIYTYKGYFTTSHDTLTNYFTFKLNASTSAISILNEGINTANNFTGVLLPEPEPPEPPEPEPEPEETIINIPTSDLVNCTINSTEINVSNLPHEITLTANEGYFFSNTPIIVIKRGWAGSVTENFTLNEDNTIATYSYNYYDSTGTVNYTITSINAIAEKKTVISDKYGLISLYKPTTEQLKQLSTKMLHTYTISDTQQEIIDLSHYILSFLSMPINVDTIGSKELTLAGINTGITLGFIGDNIVSLDFGTINIEGFYSNSMDYRNTKLEIYLPFIGVQGINVSRYMSKTVKLKYEVDLFTGDFLAVISINNIIYDTFSGNCSINVPFVSNSDTKQGNKSTNTYTSNSNNLLKDFIPKIILTTNNLNEHNRIKTMIYSNLSTITGFNKIEKVNLSITNKMTSQDIDNILSKLAEGVTF